MLRQESRAKKKRRVRKHVIHKKDPAHLSEHDQKVVADAEQYLIDNPNTPPSSSSVNEDAIDEVIESLLSVSKENHSVEAPPPRDFFDEILDEIPEEELTAVEEEDTRPMTVSEAERQIDALIADEEQWEKHVKLENKKQAYMQAIADEIVSERYINYCFYHRKGIEAQHQNDNQRIQYHLDHIRRMIKQLGMWSPAKNAYNKILNNKNLSNYDKVQQIIFLANTIKARNLHNKRSFIMRRVLRKADLIHALIAAVDINRDIDEVIKVGNQL